MGQPDFVVLTIQARLIGKHIPFEYFSRGVHAAFRPITTKWGVKFFAFKKQARENRELQMKVAAYGFAPDVGPLLSVTRTGIGGTPLKLYGFITQIAGYIGYSDFDWDKQYKLREDLIEAGFSPNDMHQGNMGEIDGEYVVVDVGCFEDMPHYKFDIIEKKEYMNV